MKISFTSVIGIILAYLFVTACGAGGGRDLGGGGRYCEADQVASTYDVPSGGEILEDNATNLDALPEGEYNFVSAEYLYVKKVDPANARRWIMLQVNETLGANDTPQSSRYCARGLKVSDPSFGSEVSGIRSMTVGQEPIEPDVTVGALTIPARTARKVDFEPSNWGFFYNQDKLMIEAPFCDDRSTDCSANQKNSFSGKVEQGKFTEPVETFLSFAEDIRIIHFEGSSRYSIVAKTDYKEDGKDVTQVLRIVYGFKAPEEEVETDNAE